MRMHIVICFAIIAFSTMPSAIAPTPIRNVTSMQVIQGDIIQGGLSSLREEDNRILTIGEINSSNSFSPLIEGFPIRDNHTFDDPNFNVVFGCDYSNTHPCLQEPSILPDNELTYVGWLAPGGSGEAGFTANYDMFNISTMPQAANGTSYMAATWRSQYWRMDIEPIPAERYFRFQWSATNWVTFISVLCADSGIIPMRNSTWHTEIYTNSNCTGSNFTDHQGTFLYYCKPPPAGNICTNNLPPNPDMWFHITQISIGVANTIVSYNLAANFNIELPENAALDVLQVTCDTDVGSAYLMSIAKNSGFRSLGYACDTTAQQSFTLEQADIRSDGTVRVFISDSNDNTLQPDLALEMIRLFVNVTGDYFVSGDDIGYILIATMVAGGILFAAWTIKEYREGGL